MFDATRVVYLNLGGGDEATLAKISENVLGI